MNVAQRWKNSLDAFELQPEDTVQIASYVEGLYQKYPEAQFA